MINSLGVHGFIFFIDKLIEFENSILRYFILNILKQNVIMFCISESLHVTNVLLFLSIFEFINTYNFFYTNYISSMFYTLLCFSYIFNTLFPFFLNP